MRPYDASEEKCIVPWHEVPYDQRREVKSDTPLETENIDKTVVNDRLEALGYKDYECLCAGLFIKIKLK